jgi:hypothetical protein
MAVGFNISHNAKPIEVRLDICIFHASYGSPATLLVLYKTIADFTENTTVQTIIFVISLYHFLVLNQFCSCPPQI